MEYLLQDLLKLPLNERLKIIEAMFADMWGLTDLNLKSDQLPDIPGIAPNRDAGK
jgi:hypothetical protein